MSQELTTKTFEHTLKTKEVEKLKTRMKEQEEIQADMESMAIEIHEEHQAEIDQLEN